MTLERLIEVLSMTPTEAVALLQETSFTVPLWSDLEKQYDPAQHEIWDIVKYPAKLDENSNDDFKRTSLALQKLAVKRVAQSMFSIPVKRTYNYNRDQVNEQEAVDILEEVYRTRNKIDASNIQRGKLLNASCEIVTIWRAYELRDAYLVEAQQTKLKLTHTTYSSKNGYSIYAQTDLNDELIVVSIGYKDKDNVEFLAVYANTETPQFILYENRGGWQVNEELSNRALTLFPVVHAVIDAPVWGGDNGTNLVAQLEEMESYQGLYIKRNALPTFTLDYGEIQSGTTKADTVETSSDSRRIIEVGKGGTMTDVTWKGAEEATSARYERIRNSYFEEIQVPDTSFSNMVKSNTSAENKELIFADAKANAKDLGGVWEELFYNELEIVKKFIGIMFSSYASVYETISIRSEIQPYSIRTKTETANYVSTAGNAMSLETKIRTLAEVDDVQAEIVAIEVEAGQDVNNL